MTQLPATPLSNNEPEERALELALQRRSAQSQLELAQQPTAWQQAALDEGVRRRPAGR